MCIFALAVAAGGIGAGAVAGTAFTAANVMANISLISGVIGGVSTAYSKYQTGKFDEQVAANNKIVADRQAEDALARGRIAETEHRRKVEGLKGAQKVAFGAGGISLGKGTPVDVLAGTAVLGEIDALAIRSSAAREAYGFRVRGVEEQAAGSLAAARGKSGAAASLLTTTGSVASKWYDLKAGA